uniref:SH3 domain-containing protein n=1 Tax=Hymenolepis diminuta TaxID=6216 RepID=A0A158QDQ9_HYMDI
LIERLKTGNEPPGDVPFIQLDVPDPPPCSTQLTGRTNGENGYAEKSSRRRQSSSIIENGDYGIYYASIQVSPSVGRVSSPFAGADPIIEPTECHKLTATPTTTCPTVCRSGRRFSVSLGSKEGNSGYGHGFLWKVFSRRSKRMIFGDDSAVPFDTTKPWRSKRRSKSVGSFIPLETEPPLLNTSEKKFSWKYKAQRSRDGERRNESVAHSRLPISQSPRESPKKMWFEVISIKSAKTGIVIDSLRQIRMMFRAGVQISVCHSRHLSSWYTTISSELETVPPGICLEISDLHLEIPKLREPSAIVGPTVTRDDLEGLSKDSREIVNVGNNGDKEAPISSNVSDVDAGSNFSVPTLVPLSAPLVKSSRSTQEMTQVAELSRSLSSPSSNRNCLHGSETKLNHHSLVSQPESKSTEQCLMGTAKNASQNGTQFQRGSIVGTTPGFNSSIAQQKAQRSTSPRRNAYHQPKRQSTNNHQSHKRNTDHRIAHGSSTSDLIAVGTCKALYDFESSQYGETFISFKSGDELRLISSSTKWHGNPDTDGWIYAETIPPSNDPKALARRGFIPAAFVEISLYSEPQPLTLPRKRDIDDCSNYRGSHNNLRSDSSFLALGQATEL